MPNKIAHFAVEATDIDRARRFYEGVFQWDFEPWGPPGFYLIRKAGIQGALQKRSGPEQAGVKGFVCSIAVDDLASTLVLVESFGGKLTGSKIQIPTVGELCEFADTEGNQVVAIQYETAIAATLSWGDENAA